MSLFIVSGSQDTNIHELILGMQEELVKIKKPWWAHSLMNNCFYFFKYNDLGSTEYIFNHQN